jgi:hypothetical protein
MYVLDYIFNSSFVVCRTPSLLSLLILTALRRLTKMFLWKTVDMLVFNFSLPVTCVQWVGDSTPNIPHQYSQHKRSGFPVGSCDTEAVDGQRGSNVYEVNPWLWQFGRGKPQLGGLSVEKAGDRKEAAQKERLLRGAETRRRRKADRA